MENKEVKTKQVKLTKDERFAELCAMELASNVAGCVQMMEKSLWPGKKSMALSQTTVKNILGEIDKFLATIDGHFFKAMKMLFERYEKCPEDPKTQKVPKEEVKKEEPEVKEQKEEVVKVKPVKKTSKKPVAKEEKKEKEPAKTPKAKKESKKPAEKTEKPKKETKAKKTKK